MDDLQTELKELKQFIADLKADRASQKEKEKRESWTKYVSVTIVFLAVLAAIATQWAGRYSSRVLTNLNSATLSQAQASDKWAYYQASSMKEKLYELANANSGTNLKKDDIDKSLSKYRTQKEDLSKEAKQLEDDREKFRADAANAGAHGGRMGDVVG
ncbi:MAG: hypothetical protein JWM68_5856, partial [Verrucomicrobiales bacterium]|nr:hypothetical protein [Verrucomicrobiales bacterium]